jgi:hypothetical protein
VTFGFVVNVTTGQLALAKFKPVFALFFLIDFKHNHHVLQ